MADFDTILETFTAAVEAGDGAALGATFTEDGVYHDTFYGAFAGRPSIADMLENYFWRDAEGFLWDMSEPVFDGRTGYARWIFSYSSTLPDSAGTRVVFDGMSRFLIADGLIEDYDEIFSGGVGLVQLDMAPERLAKIMRRQADRLKEHAGWDRHAAGK